MERTGESENCATVTSNNIFFELHWQASGRDRDARYQKTINSIRHRKKQPATAMHVYSNVCCCFCCWMLFADFFSSINKCKCYICLHSHCICEATLFEIEFHIVYISNVRSTTKTNIRFMLRFPPLNIIYA